MITGRTYYRSSLLDITAMVCAFLSLHCLMTGGGCLGDEHEPVRSDSMITRVDVKGVRSFSDEELSRVIGITSGMRFSRESLDKSCSRLLRFCGDAGYPWAKVDVYVHEDIATGGKEVLFAIEEGRRAKVSEVGFKGNSITRTEVLRRQVGIQSGDPFSLSEIENGRKKLISWDLYDEVMEPRVFEDPNPYRVSLLFPVTESKPNRLSGLVGFGSGRDGARRVWGNVGFLMKNIMGTARRFELRWSQASVDEKLLAVSYREPWIASTPFSGDLSFSQRLRESVFMQMELGLGVSTVFTDLGRAGIGFSHERLYPHGDAESQTLASVKNSVTASLAWKEGSQTGGWPKLSAFSFGASYGVRKDEGVTSGEMLFQSHFNAVMWERGSIRLSVTGGFRTASKTGGEYPAYLTVPFGGSKTVRGHRDGALYVIRALWMQNEFQFLRGSGSDLHVFFDHAVTGYPIDETTLRGSYLSGYGAGIRAHTSAGMLELDLAVSPGRGFGEARLHVGMKEEF
ncbi:MAG: POTRA domain-containing protein [Candidatus Glassbacteria bacterium]